MKFDEYTPTIYPQIENFIKSRVEKIENRLFDVNDFTNVAFVYYIENPNIQLIHYKNVLVGEIVYTMTESESKVTFYER